MMSQTDHPIVVRRLSAAPANRAESGGSQIFSPCEVLVITAAEKQRRAVTLEADSILNAARAEGARLIDACRQQAEKERRALLAEVQQDTFVRFGKIAVTLGEAVTTTTHAVWRTVLAADPTASLEICLAIARQVLSHELGCAAYVHPDDAAPLLDLAKLQPLPCAIEPNAGTERGRVTLKSERGTIEIDAQRLIEQLSSDLRQTFRQAQAAQPQNRGTTA
jgi:hypothetical protein